MKIWFTADTHFGHERTLNLSKRPFTNVMEMNNVLIENWNTNVAKEDTVYHLGDFGDYEVSRKLNGNIHLLVGNYERNDIQKKSTTIEKLQDYFYSVVTKDKLKIDLYDNSFNLVHEPSNMVNNEFNLFGHIHKLQMVKRTGLNVGVDCHNYSPIELETVLFYKNAIENFYDEDVFIQ